MRSFSGAFAALVLLGLALATDPAHARALNDLYRGARAQAMGGAFTAVADDEQAIYYNPAGLAGQRGTTIRYFSLDLEGSTDLVTAVRESREAFQNLSGDTLNTLMGKNIYGRAQVAPTIVMQGFGISILSDNQVAVLAKNQALPHISIGYQQTNGVQLGWGTSLARRANAANDLRVGLAGKLLWRRGGYKQLSLTQLLNVSQDTLHEIAGSFQRGYGVDAGLQFVRKVNSRLEVRWGLAMTDIGGTAFGEGSDPQPGNLSTGLAAVYRLPRSRLTLSYDFRHLADSIDFKKKNHFGAEVSLPLVSVYGGFSQGALSYGAAFDLWLFRVTGVSYGTERGTSLQSDTERRYLLQLALKVGM